MATSTVSKKAVKSAELKDVYLVYLMAVVMDALLGMLWAAMKVGEQVFS